MNRGFIRYSNAQEREWAIAQAERMGAKEWVGNARSKSFEGDCIVINKDSEWYDWIESSTIYETEIPLERLEQQVYWSAESEEKGYMYDTEKYMATERPDGIIVLKPRKTVKIFFVLFQNKEDGSFFSGGYPSEESRNKFIEINEEDGLVVIDKFEKEYTI